MTCVVPLDSWDSVKRGTAPFWDFSPESCMIEKSREWIKVPFTLTKKKEFFITGIC